MLRRTDISLLLLLCVASCASANLAPRNRDAWQRLKWHWARTGETFEHAKSVRTVCNAPLRIAVTTPHEAGVVNGFEMWGVRFEETSTPEIRECVFSRLNVTRGEYFSREEITDE